MYRYSISTDFPNHIVCSDRLVAEIGGSSIVTALDNLETAGDNCDVYFKEDLSVNDKSTLDGLIAVHTGEELVKPPATVTLSSPKQTDGSPFVSPCIFPSGVYLFVAGADDAGTQFHIASDTQEDVTFDWSFNDWVLMAGGGMVYTGGQLGDHASLHIYCPATPVTPNGSNTGNCNVVNGVIVPAAGDGAYDVNLANANPVLTPLKDGYWEWSFPVTGKGTVSAGVPGAAGAHLIAADYSLTHFAHKVPVLGANQFDLTVPAIEPKIILPHWKMRLILHNAGHTGLKFSWYVTTARIKTT